MSTGAEILVAAFDDEATADPALYLIPVAAYEQLWLDDSENYTATFNADSTLAACGPNSHADLLVYVLESTQDNKVPPGGETLELIQPAGGTVLIIRRS